MEKEDPKKSTTVLGRIFYGLIMPALVVAVASFGWIETPFGIAVLSVASFICLVDAVLFALLAFLLLLRRYLENGEHDDLDFVDSEAPDKISNMLDRASQEVWRRTALSVSMLYLCFMAGWSSGWVIFVGCLAIADVALNAAFAACSMIENKKANHL